MYSVLETSGQIGMQTMDRMLLGLYRWLREFQDEGLVRAIDQENLVVWQMPLS